MSPFASRERRLHRSDGRMEQRVPFSYQLHLIFGASRVADALPTFLFGRWFVSRASGAY